MIRITFDMPKDTTQFDRSKKVTPREKSICCLVVQGYSNKEISKELLISECTVETHRANVFRKLGVRNAAELQYEYGELLESSLDS